ncbi:MAG: COX15/CtaA family protein [Alphaproteobacteria bacterium]|nr:COX15/CtaA family protein [Alphaproteobacteria bacterium]MBV8548465.1 COX15/CtaA family protein [Alphaproteobacteria bacterium]
MTTDTQPRRTAPVALWLFTCCGMIFIMALLGAITRLTQSGLSITDWNPIMGALPPLDDAAWQKAFDAYQHIPQYRILNSGMDLAAFKTIFFWEWFHRLWGRMIGFVFLIPLIIFAVRRQITRMLALRLTGIFALGGLQGFIGWFMVESGLSERTFVSPYRLALHLGFALLLYCLIFWVGLGQLGDKAPQPLPVTRNGKRAGWALLCLLATTIIWGAFVAGLHAGEAYNTWPMMDGEWFPNAAFTLLPSWVNAFENLALVQFMHRWLGPTTMLLLLTWVGLHMKSATGQNKKWLHALGGMALLQVLLGITTLLTHVEIVVATAHQAGAITLLSLMLINLKRATVKA